MKPIFGTSTIQADERGRIRIPSSYRTALGDTKIYGFKNKKGCYLRIFGSDMLNSLLAGYSGMVPPEECWTSARVRGIYSHIRELEEDKQGRFTIPQNWREKLQIVKEVVFIGMGNTIELWAKEVYDEYEAQQELLEDDEDENGDEIFGTFKF